MPRTLSLTSDHANAAAGPDLSQCERELIHSPGAIQPHGALLAARADDLLITHASANLGLILGRPPEAMLGQTLRAAIGETAVRALCQDLPGTRLATRRGHALVAPDGKPLHLYAHRSGRHICVDIEPVQTALGGLTLDAMLHSVLETFTHAISPTDLCELAVRGLKSITGYDRVMAYRFDTDDHGEVIAEACEPSLETYLGLHYPAADIPPQARQLALRQRVSSIANTHYDPVSLLVDASLEEATALDLTHSSLRSVSPLHRQYLRNMNVGSSLGVALVHGPHVDGQQAGEQRLWGMLVCHNTTPRIAGPDLRAVLSLVGQVVSLLVRSLAEAESHAQRLVRNVMLGPLLDRLAVHAPALETISAAEADLLALVGAAGVLVRLSGTVQCLGKTPPRPQAERALELLEGVADGRPLAIDDLTIAYPELADCRADGSGVLLLPLGPGTDDAILWFRQEQARTVTWGGDPSRHVIVDPVTGRLSPRASFAAWKEIVHGLSAPWVDADLAIAGALRQGFEAALAERTKAELARLRYYDPLTGLPNRSLLQDQLRDAESLGGGQVALLFLDLDRFKAVNDSMGHSAGDALLVEVACRLRAVAGSHSTPARLGGDEFVVLCVGLERGAVTHLGEEIRQAIEAPFDIAGRPCHVTASIGIAVAGQSGNLDLVRAADMAMYVAKQAGGNKEVLFESSLFEHASMQFELEHEMRSALSSGDQFVLLYQPLFSIAGGIKRLAGFEALVRWRHPRRGWMSPALFIPLAEKSGLIFPLGDWVLATALQQGRCLRQAHPDANLVMNVNISAVQIPRPGFCEGIADALAAEGYPPGALCLEVTESMLTDATAASALSDIRQLGVQVAIDDFGIGYSSLSYLRRLPVDEVKLDRSFLENVEGDPRGEGFVGAVIALAHAADKPVVFEGIETQAQFDIALATGADVVQGFFFAPPLSWNAAEELVRQNRLLDSRHPAPAPHPG